MSQEKEKSRGQILTEIKEMLAGKSPAEIKKLVAEAKAFIRSAKDHDPLSYVVLRSALYTAVEEGSPIDREARKLDLSVPLAARIVLLELLKPKSRGH